MPRAYSITAEAIAEERKRVGNDLDKFEIARVIRMDKVELPEVGDHDVHLRILAVSAEHNVAHAALADTVNIAKVRGGKIYPGNSAVGAVTEVGPEVTRFRPGDVVLTHCNGEPDAYGYPLRIWAYERRWSRIGRSSRLRSGAV
jgi:crotonyl-CoA carboxylase/reductase